MVAQSRVMRNSMSLPCKVDKKGSMRPLAQCVRESVGLQVFLASEVSVVGGRCGQGNDAGLPLASQDIVLGQ